MTTRLAVEENEVQDTHAIGALASLRNPTIWYLGVIFFLANLGSYAYSIWSPQIIKSFMGADNLLVGLISGAISMLVVAAMALNNAHSDRIGERPLHVSIPLGVMACGFGTCAVLGQSPWAVVLLALVPIGIGAAYGPFWSIPCSFLVGKAAAAGIAMVATLANFAGFVGPTLVGALKSQTGDYTAGLFVLSGAAGLAALLILPLRRAAAIAGRQLPVIAK